MPEQAMLQLEELLRRMGSVEVAEDASHKYALRRALLNSTRFERNRFQLVWMRLFTVTTNLVVGGAVVTVLVVSVLSFEVRDERGISSVGAVGAQRTIPVQLVEAEPRSLPETFVSQPAVAQFASFEIRPEVRHVLEFAQPSISFAVSR